MVLGTKKIHMNLRLFDRKNAKSIEKRIERLIRECIDEMNTTHWDSESVFHLNRLELSMPPMTVNTTEKEFKEKLKKLLEEAVKEACTEKWNSVASLMPGTKQGSFDIPEKPAEPDELEKVEEYILSGKGKKRITPMLLKAFFARLKEPHNTQDLIRVRSWMNTGITRHRALKIFTGEWQFTLAEILSRETLSAVRLLKSVEQKPGEKSRKFRERLFYLFSQEGSRFRSGLETLVFEMRLEALTVKELQSSFQKLKKRVLNLLKNTTLNTREKLALELWLKEEEKKGVDRDSVDVLTRLTDQLEKGEPVTIEEENIPLNYQKEIDAYNYILNQLQLYLRVAFTPWGEEIKEELIRWVNRQEFLPGYLSDNILELIRQSEEELVLSELNELHSAITERNLEVVDQWKKSPYIPLSLQILIRELNLAEEHERELVIQKIFHYIREYSEKQISFQDNRAKALLWLRNLFLSSAALSQEPSLLARETELFSFVSGLSRNKDWVGFELKSLKETGDPAEILLFFEKLKNTPFQKDERDHDLCEILFFEELKLWKEFQNLLPGIIRLLMNTELPEGAAGFIQGGFIPDKKSFTLILEQVMTFMTLNSSGRNPGEFRDMLSKLNALMRALSEVPHTEEKEIRAFFTSPVNRSLLTEEIKEAVTQYIKKNKPTLPSKGDITPQQITEAIIHNVYKFTLTLPGILSKMKGESKEDALYWIHREIISVIQRSLEKRIRTWNPAISRVSESDFTEDIQKEISEIVSQALAEDLSFWNFNSLIEEAVTGASVKGRNLIPQNRSFSPDEKIMEFLKENTPQKTSTQEKTLWKRFEKTVTALSHDTRTMLLALFQKKAKPEEIQETGLFNFAGEEVITVLQHLNREIQGKELIKLIQETEMFHRGEKEIETLLQHLNREMPEEELIKLIQDSGLFQRGGVEGLTFVQQLNRENSVEEVKTLEALRDKLLTCIKEMRSQSRVMDLAAQFPVDEGDSLHYEGFLTKLAAAGYLNERLQEILKETGKLNISQKAVFWNLCFRKELIREFFHSFEGQSSSEDLYEETPALFFQEEVLKELEEALKEEAVKATLQEILKEALPGEQVFKKILKALPEKSVVKIIKYTAVKEAQKRKIQKRIIDLLSGKIPLEENADAEKEEVREIKEISPSGRKTVSGTETPELLPGFRSKEQDVHKKIGEVIQVLDREKDKKLINKLKNLSQLILFKPDFRQIEDIIEKLPLIKHLKDEFLNLVKKKKKRTLHEDKRAERVKKQLEKEKKELEKKQAMQREFLETTDAGLMILAPYLERFFVQHGLLNEEKDDFIDEESRLKARDFLILLLGEQPEPEEDEEENDTFVVANILTGVEMETPLEMLTEFSEEEKNAAERLLIAVITHWNQLKGMGIKEFQGMFLNRKAECKEIATGYSVKVEHKTLDILMSKLPWTISLYKPAWLGDKMVHVEWKTGFY